MTYDFAQRAASEHLENDAQVVRLDDFRKSATPSPIPRREIDHEAAAAWFRCYHAQLDPKSADVCDLRDSKERRTS